MSVHRDCSHTRTSPSGFAPPPFSPFQLSHRVRSAQDLVLRIVSTRNGAPKQGIAAARISRLLWPCQNQRRCLEVIARASQAVRCGSRGKVLGLYRSHTAPLLIPFPMVDPPPPPLLRVRSDGPNVEAPQVSPRRDGGGKAQDGPRRHLGLPAAMVAARRRSQGE